MKKSKPASPGRSGLDDGPLDGKSVSQPRANLPSHEADNPEAATRTADNIHMRIDELVTFPNRGRIGRKQGTRELVLAPMPYIVVYRVKESIVEILQIRHGAQGVN